MYECAYFDGLMLNIHDVASPEKCTTKSALNNEKKRIALGLEPTTLSLRGG